MSSTDKASSIVIWIIKETGFDKAKAGVLGKETRLFLGDFFDFSEDFLNIFEEVLFLNRLRGVLDLSCEKGSFQR